MVTVENTWVEVEESGADIVVIPIGAIEQHGPHLPLGTDWLAADRVASRIAENLNAYLLPALPFSNSQEHLDFKGSVSLRPQTLALVIEQIILSLAHQGFKKFVIVNSHGGNWVIKPAIRDINFRHPGIPPLCNIIMLAFLTFVWYNSTAEVKDEHKRTQNDALGQGAKT